MMLHALAEAIGLPDLLGEYAHETLALVYAHCLDYKSLNRMLHWFERTDLNVILNLQDLTERRLVGALEALEKFDAMALQRSIFENTRAFMGLKTDRKSTRLNSSHGYISYAVFCLKKKKYS